MRAVNVAATCAFLVPLCVSCGSDAEPGSREFDDVVRQAQEYADAPHPEAAVEAGALLDRGVHDLERLRRTMEDRLTDESDDVTARWREIEHRASAVLRSLRTIVADWPRTSEAEAESLIRTVEGQRIELNRWLDEGRYLGADSVEALVRMLADDLGEAELAMDEADATTDTLSEAGGSELRPSLPELHAEWSALQERTRRLRRASDPEFEQVWLELVREVAELRRDLALLRWARDAAESPEGT